MPRPEYALAGFSQKLSVHESNFICAYLLNGGNGTQAAIDTEWASGDDRAHAASIAARLLAQPRLREAVQEQLEALTADNLITVQRIYHALSKLTFYDPRKAYDGNGDPLPLSQLPEDLAFAVEGFETETRIIPGIPGTTRITKYKFANKTNAAKELLNRKAGPTVQRHEVSGPNGMPLGPAPKGIENISSEVLEKFIATYEKLEKPKIEDAQVVKVEDAQHPSQPGDTTIPK